MRGSEFTALQAFTEVARHQSFARAAEALRVGPSTVSQIIKELEERLGVTLLNRTTRRVALTSVGERLLSALVPALDAMEEAVDEARDQRASPIGVVRLLCPRPAFTSHVEPALARLRSTYPDVELDLTLEESPYGLSNEGYDLIIQRSDFVDADVIATDLGGDLRLCVVASPQYLSRFGMPMIPDDLDRHACILWRPSGHAVQRWSFACEGRPLTMSVNGPLIVSHCDAAVAAAVRGVGIAHVLESYAASSIETGRIIKILTAYRPELGSWQLCYRRSIRLTAAAKVVIETLQEASLCPIFV